MIMKGFSVGKASTQIHKVREIHRPHRKASTQIHKVREIHRPHRKASTQFHEIREFHLPNRKASTQIHEVKFTNPHRRGIHEARINNQL
jgi:hypothetical protein